MYFHVQPRKAGSFRSNTAIPWCISCCSNRIRLITTGWSASFHRFNVACCVTQEQFRRETRAVTRAGQIKDPSGRHEKDDRYSIDDRSRYVLGWNNSEKIAALEIKRSHLASRMGKVIDAIIETQGERKTLASRLDALTRLDEVDDFEELDWASVATEIARLSDERKRLESASDELRQLNEQLRDRLEARRKQSPLC